MFPYNPLAAARPLPPRTPKYQEDIQMYTQYSYEHMRHSTVSVVLMRIILGFKYKVARHWKNETIRLQQHLSFCLIRNLYPVPGTVKMHNEKEWKKN